VIPKPTFFSERLEDISMDQVGKYRAILIDVDNTLLKHHEESISEKKRKWISSIKKKKIKIALASNTSKKRAQNLSKILNLDVFVAYKPFPFSIKNWIRDNGLETKDVLLIGDQVFTDHLAAIFAKIDSVLVKPMTDKDFIVTRLVSRRLEKIIYNLWSK